MSCSRFPAVSNEKRVSGRRGKRGLSNDISSYVPPGFRVRGLTYAVTPALNNQLDSVNIQLYY